MKNKEIRKELLRIEAGKEQTGSAKQRMLYAAGHCEAELCKAFGCKREGFNQEEALVMREKYGGNMLPAAGKRSIFRRLAAAFVNPFSVILAVLAFVSLFTDVIFAEQGERNYVTLTVILVMIAVSGILRFVQETKSGNAAAKLSSMISTTACVLRQENGKGEIPVGEIVVGDRVFLSAGDMIPADMRILSARDLFVAQSALTGESAPVEKNALSDGEPSATSACLAFMGTNVVSGSGEGIVFATGTDTVFGQTARSLSSAGRRKTGFDKGVNAVSRILICFMLVMVPVVLLINGFTKHDWLNAVLFSVSVAVGLTPEMLPMIVTACLAKGSVAMSGKKVIVKNLNAIQDLGSVDVLCTDKTGTLTQDKVVLEMHLNADGKEDARVLRHAFLNSYYQTGLKNLLDVAIIQRSRELIERGEMDADVLTRFCKADELPFDFERRRMSVIVQDNSGKTQLITKGAVEEMLSVCSFAETEGKVCRLDDALRNRIKSRAEKLNAEGMRVLCVAQKSIDGPVGEWETDMVLMGYLAFLDPPKASAADAISKLKQGGVAVKVLTGDNEKVAACVCKKVGLSGRILTGAQLEEMDDVQLREAAEETVIFAKLSPIQKERVVRVLRENGHTVGYMGDGINDAPAMRAADVGISVDTAVDIAKESAGVILLEKELTVLADGVREGRKTYANMMKYIKITASSNFGNMFSVLIASALLPFLPMTSVQLILLNLVYDLSCVALPWDNVDEELLKKPAEWDSSSVRRFMFCFGPVSSLFDVATFAALYFIVCPAVCGAPFSALGGAEAALFVAVFQTGWFIESMFTQSLVVHTLRSRKLPFAGSRASRQVLLSTFAGILVLTAVPYTPMGAWLGLRPMSGGYFVLLFAIVVGYFLLATAIKALYVKKFGKLL